jgi:hypothetical protein
MAEVIRTPGDVMPLDPIPPDPPIGTDIVPPDPDITRAEEPHLPEEPPRREGVVSDPDIVVLP